MDIGLELIISIEDYSLVIGLNVILMKAILLNYWSFGNDYWKENISANPHSKVVVSLYAMGDEETIVGKQGENYIKDLDLAYYQGTPLGTASMSINSIDTLWNPNLGLNYFPFEESVTISKDFAIVADFTALVTYSDTAYMPCDEPGNGLGLHYAQYSRDPNQYLWISTDFGTNGTLNVNIPLFAVVDNSSANINSHDFFHGMQMTVYPNPVSEVANIDFALQHNTDVTFEIININGQVVNSVNLGYQTIGTHTHRIVLMSLQQKLLYFYECYGYKIC